MPPFAPPRILPSHRGSNILQRLQAALTRARRAGYHVRLEPLGGVGAASCEIDGRIHLFVDLSQTADEQLSGVETILASGPSQIAGSR